jgi:membrane protein implicated in regulation of membrane protease activity
MPTGLIVGGLTLFLLIVIPFTFAYRAEARGGSAVLSPGQAAAAAPTLGRTAVTGASTGIVGESVSYLGERLQNIDGPAIVLQKTPSQVPYASAAQLPEALVADLIPRALWPTKPVIDPGFQFTQQYYGAPQNVLTASVITPQGDLYRYGGWVPVIIGMSLLGCLMAVLDDALDVRANPHAALLVLLLWPVLGTPESYTGILAALPGLILTWLVVTAVTFRRCSPQGSETDAVVGQVGSALSTFSATKTSAGK